MWMAVRIRAKMAERKNLARLLRASAAPPLTHDDRGGRHRAHRAARPDLEAAATPHRFAWDDGLPEGLADPRRKLSGPDPKKTIGGGPR